MEEKELIGETRGKGLSRRDFLRLVGVSFGGVVLGGGSLTAAVANSEGPQIPELEESKLKDFIGLLEEAQENCRGFVNQHHCQPLGKIFLQSQIQEVGNQETVASYFFPPLSHQKFLKKVIPQLRTLLSLKGKAKGLLNPKEFGAAAKEVYQGVEIEVREEGYDHDFNSRDLLAVWLDRPVDPELDVVKWGAASLERDRMIREVVKTVQEQTVVPAIVRAEVGPVSIFRERGSLI